MDNQTSYDLIAKHLAGETSESEDALLWKWIDLKEENLIVFQELVDLYANNSELKQEWNGEKIVLFSGFSKKEESNKLKWLKIAASISFLISIVYFLIPTTENDLVTFKTKAAETKEIVLPDGSKVWLNSSSMVSYNRKEFKRNRQLKLDGEAFFQIQERKEVFVIEYDSVMLVANSGEYNIQSYPNQNEKVVIISDGVAQFVDLRNDEVTLNATSGERLVSLAEHGIISLEINADINYDSWRTGNYLFDNTSANIVAEMISKDQGFNFQIPDREMRFHQIEGYFENSDPQQLLHYLMLELDAHIEVNNRENYLVKNKNS